MPRPFSQEEPLRFFAEFGKFKFDFAPTGSRFAKLRRPGCTILANHAGTYGDKRNGPW
jgi:hypothetical protein